MKEIKSLCANILDYVKELSTKTAELHRKDLVIHFEETYSRNDAALSSIRSSVDKVLQFLCKSNIIRRRQNWSTVRNGKTYILRGYYVFIKEIPADFTWEELRDENRKREND